MSVELRVGQAFPAHRVRAFNAAVHSDNKIHDDDVAKLYGFKGGLVPGVAVHAYMASAVANVLGRGWVERGAISTRFAKPFYEGEEAFVSVVVRRADGESVEVEVTARNAEGVECGIGTASLPGTPPEPPPIREFSEAPAPSDRPMASESVLSGIDILGSLSQQWEAGDANEVFLAEIQDDNPIFRGPDALSHPGYLIRNANTILVANVMLGPWIHVSSEAVHFGAASDGDVITTRGRVLETFERRGHKFVVLDVLMVANGVRPLVRVRHTAIYEVRRVA